MPGLAAAAMLFEGAVHYAFFGASSFTSALLSHSVHEWWMRLSLTWPLIIGAFIWSSSISERNQRLQELQAVHERLRYLNARLAHGEMLQRTELAERLHEHVGQTIAAAGMYLAVVDRDKLDDAEKAAVQSAAQAISRATCELRNVSLDLKPASLDGQSLKPAIEAFARRTMRSTGVSVDVCYDESLSCISPDAATAAFQAVCEAIESAAEGSDTSVVRVTSVPDAVPFQVSVDCDVALDDVPLASHDWLKSIGGDIVRSTNGLTTRFAILVPALAE